jgi:hypothetical protein
MSKRFLVAALMLFACLTAGCTARDVRDVIDPHRRFMEVPEEPADDPVLFPRPRDEPPGPRRTGSPARAVGQNWK